LIFCSCGDVRAGRFAPGLAGACWPEFAPLHSLRYWLKLIGGLPAVSIFVGRLAATRP
jgi:hypothetical protein